MIEYKSSNYELRYSIQRIKMIENETVKSVVTMMRAGSLSLSELCACIGYAIKLEGAEGYLSPKQGIEIAEEKLKEEGAYFALSDEVADALERDCPFFFPAV